MRRNSGIIGPTKTITQTDASGIHEIFDHYNCKIDNIWPKVKEVTSISGSNGTNLDENVTTTFTVNTEGFQDGDTVYYSIVTVSGTTLTGADFSSGSLTGSFTVNASGVGTFNVNPIGDGIVENNTCKIQIRDGSVSGTILAESATLTMADAAANVFTYSTGNPASWMVLRTKQATNAGFNSNGMWINGNASSTTNSYPVVTNEGFTGTNLELSFVAVKNENCADHGFCVFRTGTSPVWAWGVNNSRIAFQWNCANPNWYPASGSGSGNISGANTYSPSTPYYTTITINLSTGATTTVIKTGSFSGTTVVNHSGSYTGATLSSLSGWNASSSTWEVGFDADQDNTSYQSYFRDITITVT